MWIGQQVRIERHYILFVGKRNFTGQKVGRETKSGDDGDDNEQDPAREYRELFERMLLAGIDALREFGIGVFQRWLLQDRVTSAVP